MNVVVVNQKISICDAISQSLSQANIHSQSVQDQTHFNLIDMSCVDCVLLDFYLGDWDGIQAIKHLSKIDYKGGILLVTGMSADVIALFETAVMSEGLSYWGTIKKPIEQAELVVRLSSGADKPEKARALIPKTIVERALFTNQMHVVYQPKVALASGQIVGFEALSRLNVGKGRQAPPDIFIPLIERYDLYAEFNAQLITKSIEQLQDSQYANYPLSLNFSVEHLSRALAEFIIATAKRLDYDLSNLTIEITEAKLMNANPEISTALECLSDKGIRISLDDFGSGFNAFRQLADFSFSELKLDKFYTQNAIVNEQCHAVLNTALKLAKKLSLDLVVEGVETEAQKQHLLSVGIEVAQGFKFGQPAPIRHYPQIH